MREKGQERDFTTFQCVGPGQGFPSLDMIEVLGLVFVRSGGGKVFYT